MNTRRQGSSGAILEAGFHSWDVTIMACPCWLIKSLFYDCNQHSNYSVVGKHKRIIKYPEQPDCASRGFLQETGVQKF